MKIRISKDLVIDSRTLIRIEWHKYYPRLAIHEKYEQHLKWTLRIIGIIGIVSSLIVFETWYASLGFALLIFLAEQFLERTTIEFTTMVFQSPPYFEVDYGQWKTNGFIIPIERNSGELVYFGPSYQDEEYAVKFFDYLRSWVNNDSFDDTEDNLVVSIVIEPDEEYTTYIYANLKRKRLDEMFKFLGGLQKFEKYGKRQQEFFAQMFYWNTLTYKDGYYIKQFLNFHQDGDSFYLTPSVIQPFGFPPKFLINKSIKKYHLKVRNRSEIQKDDPEYIMKPVGKLKDTSGRKIIWRKSDEVQLLRDIQKTFSQAEDLGFMPNEGRNVGVINMCFTDCVAPFEAYKELVSLSKGEEINLTLIEEGLTLGLVFSGNNLIEPITLSGIPVNRTSFDEFLQVYGGGKRVVFAIGYPPSQSRQLILEKEMSPVTVIWNYSKT